MRRDIFQDISGSTTRANLVLISRQAMIPKVIVEHFDISRQSASSICASCPAPTHVSKARRRGNLYELKVDKMKEIRKDQFRKIREG